MTSAMLYAIVGETAWIAQARSPVLPAHTAYYAVRSVCLWPIGRMTSRYLRRQDLGIEL